MFPIEFYWKAKNVVQTPVLKVMGNRGLLPTKYDPRDHISDLGLSWFTYTPKQKQLSHFKFQFNQNPFNICSFAAGILALSDQMGIRLSVRFAVALAVKLGYVTGDGFSWQRAILDIMHNYGAVLYTLVPDEINGMNFEEYSKWLPEYDKILAEEAPKIKIGYKKLSSERGILEALDNGFVVITASKWYQDMFNPFAPNFFLKMTGFPIGGHAYRITGYRESLEEKGDWDLETPQTFGESFGDKGKAWSATTIGLKYYNNWYCHFNGKPIMI